MSRTTNPPPPPPQVQERIEAAGKAEREGRRNDARACYEEALRRLPSADHAATASALLRWIARTHDSDPPAALDVSEAAVAVAEIVGDPFTLASALNSRAAIFFTLGELDASEELFLRARHLAGRAGAGELGAMVAQNLANIASIRGDLDLALIQFQASLAGYRKLGLQAYVGPLLNNVGRLQTELGEWDAAERTFDEARRHCRENGDRVHEVVVEVNRARLHVERADYPRADEICRHALALAHEAGEERWTAEIWRNLGVIRREMGALRDAARYLERARTLSEKRSDAVVTADVAREQAAVYRATGENPKTLRALNDAHRLFQQLRARRELIDVDRRLRELEEEFLEIVREWGTSIERKDRYTHGHCERVADYACRLALRAGMDGADLKWFRMGALLHDVGKVRVPLEILNKPGALTEEERAIMATHPAEGVALLEGVEFPWDVRPMIRHHHERWDGSGYPDGLAGEEIPFAARILTVADVWDALTTSRSYRPAFSPPRAWAIMESEAGKTVDTELLRLFYPLVEVEIESTLAQEESGAAGVLPADREDSRLQGAQSA